MAITLRADKGSELTHAELDGNFETLVATIATLEETIVTQQALIDALTARIDALESQ